MYLIFVRFEKRSGERRSAQHESRRNRLLRKQVIDGQTKLANHVKKRTPNEVNVSNTISKYSSSSSASTLVEQLVGKEITFAKKNDII
jgi:hypothetical protein